MVVPNLNREEYLRACIDSINDQGYSNLELIFVDGGSEDNSVSIARSYGGTITVLISEPDRGQSDAINKGLARSTGDIVAYLNSDDLLEPGSLAAVADYFAHHPHADWLVGSCRVFGEGVEDWILQPEGWDRLLDTVLPWQRPQRYVFPQSGACFMRRGLVDRLGTYDVTLHYSMDMEYYARAAFAGAKMEIISQVLAAWRIHPSSKSWTRGCAYAFRKDECAVLERYISSLPEAQGQEARLALRAELPNLLFREASYWTPENRLRGLALFVQLAVRHPEWIVRRPWLGGVRRALAGRAV